jgi:hypothetical protein
MTAPTAGTRVTRENFIHIPPGSILAHGTTKLIVLGHGYAARVGTTGVYPLFSCTHYSIEEVRDWGPEPENVTTFKQRARTVCIGSGNDSSVAIGPIIRALGQIGIPDTLPPLGVGMFFHVGDPDLRRALSHKRGVVYGYGDPNHWEGYAEVDLGTERAIKGGLQGMPRTVRVLTMDNPDTDQYLIPPTEEDAAEIARLRGQIWVIGQQAKSANRWCESYEQAVGTLGVSSALAHTVTGAPRPEGEGPDGVPVVEPGDDCAAYPLGAVFEFNGGGDDRTARPDYSDPGNNWNWTRRVQGERWPTMHFMGPNGGHHGGRRRVLWDGTGQMYIPITRPLLDHLPVGTMLGYRGSTSRYIKEAEDRWVQGGSPACSNDFFTTAQIRNGERSTVWHVMGLPDHVRA